MLFQELLKKPFQIQHRTASIYETIQNQVQNLSMLNFMLSTKHHNEIHSQHVTFKVYKHQLSILNSNY